MNSERTDPPDKLALRSETSLRLLIENLKDVAIVTLALDGCFASWNSGAEHILGYTEQEILGRHVSLIFTPEDRALGADQMELERARVEGRSEDERWHMRKDGSRFFASGILTLLRDEQGVPYGFAKIMRDLTKSKLAEQALQEAHSLLEQRVLERTAQLNALHEVRRELLRKMVIAQEEERTRIARELHDQTGQQLTALTFGLNKYKSLKLPAAVQRSLDALILSTQQLMNDLHTIALSLRPPMLDLLGLESALQDYGHKWSGLSGIAIEIECTGFDQTRLPPEIETTIYRIAQESLTNVMRHAPTATQVSIGVARRGDIVEMILEDNGPGFDVAATLSLPLAQRRLGLLGMQERAELMGGNLTVESYAGIGTIIRLTLPVPPPEFNP